MKIFERLYRNPGLLLLHAAFLMILIGGMITWLTAKESRMTLQPGVPVEKFGITAELLSFETEYYSGGTIPRNYVSYLLINGRESRLSVNNPLEINGWRIYQQGFTAEGCSIVTIRNDSVGTAVTFSGYALFCIAGLLCLLRRRRLLVLAGVFASFGASASDLPTVTDVYADSMARTQVIYQGRVTTFSTVAHDALKKIYGQDSFRGLSAERAIISLTEFPEQWNEVDIIKCGDEYISYSACFDEYGRYVLGGEPTVDERVGLFLLLRHGRLFSEVAETDERLSVAEVEGEIIYNALPLTLIAFILLFVAAAVSFFYVKVGRIVGWFAFGFQLLLILFEAWLSGRGPFASMFETLQLLAASVALIALLMRGMSGVGLLAAGCLALVAHLQAANPIVTPLMPVLHSPWLSMHVSLVMLSYALFVIIAVLALKSRQGDVRCRKLLRIAVYLLGLGICSGAVWANESWGRYWGWDPKETWALITFLLYAIPLHLRRPSRWWYILPLLSVAMTYFGVNYMNSLHSYG